MKGYNVIDELYHGRLDPHIRGIAKDTPLYIAEEAFVQHEYWFNEQLKDEAKKRFDELMHCHNDIIDALSYENFRTGFQLGAMFVMEAVSDSKEMLTD